MDENVSAQDNPVAEFAGSDTAEKPASMGFKEYVKNMDAPEFAEPAPYKELSDEKGGLVKDKVFKKLDDYQVQVNDYQKYFDMLGDIPDSVDKYVVNDETVSSALKDPDPSNPMLGALKTLQETAFDYHLSNEQFNGVLDAVGHMFNAIIPPQNQEELAALQKINAAKEEKEKAAQLKDTVAKLGGESNALKLAARAGRFMFGLANQGLIKREQAELMIKFMDSNGADAIYLVNQLANKMGGVKDFPNFSMNVSSEGGDTDQEFWDKYKSLKSAKDRQAAIVSRAAEGKRGKISI